MLGAPDDDLGDAAATPDPLPPPEPPPLADPAGADPPPLPILRRELPLRQAVERALASQTAACAQLVPCPPGDVARRVHALRKLVRQTRALVRLIGAGAADDRPAKRALRDFAAASRTLSHARDAEVLPDALELLPLPLRQKTPALAENLLRQRDAVNSDGKTAAAVDAAAAAVGVIEARYGGQLPENVTEKLLLEGMRQSLRRVREARKLAGKRPRPEHIHDLRKSCKDLRHQLEWLGVDSEHAFYAELCDIVRGLGFVTDLLALDGYLRGDGRQVPASERAAVQKALEKSLARSTAPWIARCKSLIGKDSKRIAAALLAELGW